MTDCYIIGRAIGICYDEEKPERDPCGVSDGALVYEDVEKSTEDEEPVFVRPHGACPRHPGKRLYRTLGRQDARTTAEATPALLGTNQGTTLRCGL